MMNLINTIVCYIWKLVRRTHPKSSHHKEIFFSICFIFYSCEMMDVHNIYCDHHFMMSVTQIHHAIHINLTQACTFILSQ